MNRDSLRKSKCAKLIYIPCILYWLLVIVKMIEGDTEEEAIPRAFIMRVEDFNKESESIFSEFEAIRAKYKRGEDITADLKQFRSKRPGIFALIDDLYHKEVDVEDKIERAHLEPEKVQKLFEFKERFAELADEIDLLVLHELGLGG